MPHFAHAAFFCGVAPALLKSFLFWQFLQRRCMTDSVDSSGFWCAALAIVTSHIHRELSFLRPICTFLMTFCAKLIINENHRFRDVFSMILGARWSHRVSTILCFWWKIAFSGSHRASTIPAFWWKINRPGSQNSIDYFTFGTFLGDMQKSQTPKQLAYGLLKLGVSGS